MDEEHGFDGVTRLAAALETFREAVTPLGRTQRRGLAAAERRVLATPVDARRSVPHFERAAMDGYAVRASDTFDATDRSPVALDRFEVGAGSVAPGQAQWVHTGSPLPAGADAVVKVEETTRRDDQVEIETAVAEGTNVAPVGEDVREEQRLFEAGHQLRPSDLGLLKATGVREVEVYERPTVGVVPTGDELVQDGPEPGEVVETNGFTVSRYVERWGGTATYRQIVSDDPAALRSAIQRDLTKDVVVTNGGSSVGKRDHLADVIDDLGEILFHGVAVKPGHPVGAGLVEDTPVLMLPGYPVSTIVGAVQLLRPLLKHVGHLPVRKPPAVEAKLARKIPSEIGARTFARVSLETEDAGDSGADDTGDGETIAEPTRASGAGVLSSVALADGWVVVPESREGIPAGETVAAENWEYDE
ncbi:molybdopterin molybdotransferase MoeA [Halapricum hydrolyticum]|uniref:Molybdopterin molybdotransferase MoeA n=1 Tax=Halapricum hydrolyticum TaxID=2979991 RepID=A0AAE3LGH1_9EURY|nr:gephyrin-like molybdotransferase Glp [Halapricum hydrolyticum]MCU4716786.1 molybdopterin molybdotransferase MoeA [Halapricum hydrolyticum]MCU4725609.1 molybdopterin molybdotransferase MoeA [Halapricum hydrolyticum]